MAPIEHLHVVAIAGGSGTRFWPLSRHARPKQLLPTPDGDSLLSATFRRVASLTDPSRRWMVVGAPHAAACQQAVSGFEASHVLVEPVGRNTAPAVGLAALVIKARDPQALMAVFPADHHVADPRAFAEAVEIAARVASEGPIVTLGITPTRPETGYGYIERAEPMEQNPGVFSVRRFCEKPARSQAEAFLAQGNFFWNAGIFVMSVGSFWREFERQLPEHARVLQGLAHHIEKASYTEALAEAYAEMAAISLDYGIMEGAESVAVVPVDCGWSDVGSLPALAELGPRDEAGNSPWGRTLLLDCQHCIVHNEDGASGSEHLVAAVGLRDMVVVRTGDATLVVPIDEAQRVREVVAELERLEWRELL
ncbi:MAG: sugar phosphate nucleotidyltransferase [Myxococcota bacterium]